MPNAVNRAIHIYFGFLRKITTIGNYTVSWIDSNLQMATVYLVFHKSVTVY